MKKIMITLMVLMGLMVGCASGETETPAVEQLLVGEKSYSVAEFEKMPVTESVFMDVTYNGVTVTALLEDAGYSLDEMSALKAVAADGYTVNYDLAQIEKGDVIVAYAQADSPLTKDDGTFRMVLPEEEGKLNVRMLAELQVVE